MSTAALGCGAEMAAEAAPDYNSIRYVGFVHDQSGKPVPGATVVVTGVNTEIETDRNGRFRIAIKFDPGAPSVLFVCKGPGFKSSQGIKKASPSERNLILVSCTLRREVG
jgi:hypothetical protein